MWETVYNLTDKIGKNEVSLKVFKNDEGKIINGEIIFEVHTEKKNMIYALGLSPEELLKLKNGLE